MIKTEDATQTTAQGDTATGGEQSASTTTEQQGTTTQGTTTTPPPPTDPKPPVTEETSTTTTEATAPVIPEKYIFTPPEGFTLDEASVAFVEPLMRDMKLTQEQADKALAAHAKFVAEQGRRQFERWDAETKKAYTPEQIALGISAIKDLGNDKLKAVLEQTGLGSHPDVVGWFIDLGKKIADDKVEAGKSSLGKALDSLYPSTAGK